MPDVIEESKFESIAPQKGRPLMSSQTQSMRLARRQVRKRPILEAAVDRLDRLIPRHRAPPFL